MSLTPKERVLMTLDHQQPDRAPLDLGGAFTTTINVAAYRNLRQHLGLADQWHLVREQTQSVVVAEDVRQMLGIDVVGVYERAPLPALETPTADHTITSEWGIVYRQAEGFGAPYTAITAPLAQATLDDLEQYPWPDPLAPARFAGLAEETAQLENSPYAVVGNLGWTEIFGVAWYLRGFENFMIDLLTNKDFARALLRRITDYQLARYNRFLELCGAALDVILFADDLGSQNSLFMSPQTYREMIKPYHAELLSSIKAQTTARLMFHSCGSIMPLLDDFIEIGLNILNPVQVSAANMDTALLKKRYGNRVIFWGAIDTHHVLPNGTPNEVCAEVNRRLADLGPDGGYIVAPVHVIQADVPPENVVALYKTVADGGIAITIND